MERPAAGKQSRPAISARELSKRYGRRHAVSELSFTVESGQICALLGPNGAGKTSTMRLLVGLSSLDAGSAWILGEPVGLGAGVLRRIGVVIDGPALIPHLTGTATCGSCGRPHGGPGRLPHWTMRSTLPGSAAVGLSPAQVTALLTLVPGEAVPMRSLAARLDSDASARNTLSPSSGPARGDGRAGLAGEVVAGLLAELLSEWGDLLVEGCLPDAECLGGREDAGVPGDDQQPVQASPGAGSDEGAAERFGQVARVDAGGLRRLAFSCWCRGCGPGCRGRGRSGSGSGGGSRSWAAMSSRERCQVRYSLQSQSGSR